MDWIKVEIHPDDKRRAFNWLVGSNVQKTLHNELLVKIAAVRNALESCMVHELPILQGKLRAYREFLDFIHSNDSPDVKEFRTPK
jgi:hypothetical protein